MSYETPITAVDSDNDGMSDEFELENGFDPNDPSDCPSWYCGGGIKPWFLLLLANEPPVADASLDQSVEELSEVSLTGIGTDSNGTIKSYKWEQISGTSVTLVGSDTAVTSFTAPDVEQDEALVFELTVRDNYNASAKDTVVVTVTNIIQQTAEEFYISNISGPIIQGQCINCHIAGGAAASSALLYLPSSEPNYQSINYDLLEDYIINTDSGAELILSRARGVSHGGGVQLPSSSEGYQALATFVDLLGQSPAGFYASNVSSEIIQGQCINCHVAGGIASSSALVYLPSTEPNYQSINYDLLADYILNTESGAELLLSRARGVSHGGGVQLPSNSEGYQTLVDFIELLGECGNSCLPGNGVGLFAKVTMASSVETLRRAAMIFAGRAPTPEEEAAVDSGGDSILKQTIRDLMTGDGFHQFLTEGANDRLLTDRNIVVQPEIFDDAVPYYPDFTEQLYALRVQGLSGDAWTLHRLTNYARARAPVELIAYVVENERPYSEVLTADYTMVTPYSNVPFRAGAIFDNDSENDVIEFQPGVVTGQYLLANDFQYEFTEELRGHYLGGGVEFVYPQAGILNTPSFLGRYPSTDTNVNRARSRWTYYHFLGVDIEKSAARTTDPDALADTNNPTLNNPACIACHTSMDPVAGAFQNYGNAGFYRDAWGGMDSLPDTYKYPSGGMNPYDSTRLVLVYDGNGVDDWFAWDNFIDGQYGSGLIDSCCQPVNVIGGTATLAAQTVGDTLTTYRDTTLISTSYIPNDRTELLQDGLPALYTWYDGSTKRFNAVRVYDMTGGGEQLVLDDDFSNGISGHWQITNGNWRVENGQLVIDGQGLLLLRLDSLDVGKLSDLRVEVDVVDAVAGIGIWMRADPMPDFSGYVQGDTWYRWMRNPGFNDQDAPDNTNSLQWLAAQIVQDERFYSGTVKFWWPAVMGIEALRAPEDPTDANFDAQLLAFETQYADIAEMATDFSSHSNLKDLLVDMVMSPWFRMNSVLDDNENVTALDDIGTERMLTPENLERKTRGITGYSWGGGPDYSYEGQIWRSNITDRYHLYLGGIDSNGVTERANAANGLLSQTILTSALESSCSVVIQDFNRELNNRKLFKDVTRNTTPVSNISTQFNVSSEYPNHSIHVVSTALSVGTNYINVAFTNDWADGVSDRNLFIDRIRVLDSNSAVIEEFEMEDLLSINGATYSPGSGGEFGDSWTLWSNGFVQLPVTITNTDTYTFEIFAAAQFGGPDLPIMSVSVSVDDPFSANSPGANDIKLTLQRLHKIMWGEDVSLTDSELLSSYQLFVEAWQDNVDNNLVINSNPCNMPYDFDWNTPSGYWNDPSFTLATWKTVISYFMSDYKYLHQ